MNQVAGTLHLADLTPTEVRTHLDRDSRLIIPVGAFDQYGPHLPIGASTLVAEAFADRFAREFGILRSPTLQFGVNVPADRTFAGAAGLRGKTLHAFMNDLLGCWEDAGFAEFIVLTVHDFDSHVEAIATVTGTAARVRVVEALNMDLSGILDGDNIAEHGGEALTSLMLHLYPGKVRMSHAIDHPADDNAISTLRRLSRIPISSAGAIGTPTLASAEKGRRLFEHISERIRSRVFAAD